MVTIAPKRLKKLMAQLDSGLVERQQTLQLTLLCALSGEHTLLVGPPGTAKSELARRLHCAFADGQYFERLLTRFSVPEELFGPLSIQALEEDRYERQTRGYLPEATIAFIDEVFKANSAILNALLTLLNEREFDNGDTRQAAPLISVIGASNEIPDDAVGEAFFDRFLLRLTVEPVTLQGFSQLIQRANRTPWPGVDEHLQISSSELAELQQQASGVELDPSAQARLEELRAYCDEAQISVSDRRWVKTVGLLRIAAASNGRSSVVTWDLLLLPFCLASGKTDQQRLQAWLTQRLGVAGVLEPENLKRVVEAFELQLEAEQKANDLDYDEAGRLRFSNQGQGEIATQIEDAKGGAEALRLRYNRQRRYGEYHIQARTGEIDAAKRRIHEYIDELETIFGDFANYCQQNLWIDQKKLNQITTNLQHTAGLLKHYLERLATARQGYLDLPRLEQENGQTPAPILTTDFLQP